MDEHGAYLLQRDVERRRDKMWLPKGAQSVFNRPFQDADIERMANIAADIDARSYSGGWVNLLNYATATVVPTSVNTFTTITAVVSPFPDSFIPANSLHIGTRLRMRAFGTIQSAAGTATFTLVPTFGATAGAGNGGTGIMGSTPAGTAGGATGTLGFFMDYDATVQVIGAASTAQIIGMGFAVGINATIGNVSLIQGAAGITTPTALATIFTTTAAQSFVPCSVCSSSSATNAFLTYGFSVEQLN
jgi:hypothetical protein